MDINVHAFVQDHLYFMCASNTKNTYNTLEVEHNTCVCHWDHLLLLFIHYCDPFVQMSKSNSNKVNKLHLWGSWTKFSLKDTVHQHQWSELQVKKGGYTFNNAKKCKDKLPYALSLTHMLDFTFLWDIMRSTRDLIHPTSENITN